MRFSLLQWKRIWLEIFTELYKQLIKHLMCIANNKKVNGKQFRDIKNDKQHNFRWQPTNKAHNSRQTSRQNSALDALTKLRTTADAATRTTILLMLAKTATEVPYYWHQQTTCRSLSVHFRISCWPRISETQMNDRKGHTFSFSKIRMLFSDISGESNNEQPSCPPATPLTCAIPRS